MKFHRIFLPTLLALGFQCNLCADSQTVPSLDEALAAREDAWGNAALQQSNGPDYDFFANLLPPLRYVNTQFRYYPIVLSAPTAVQKARLCSDGSGINSRANQPTWHELGTPVSFLVGKDAAPFGSEIYHLEEPRYLNGHLPVVQIVFNHQGATYLEQTFAPTTPGLADSGVLFTSFTLPTGASGIVEARIETGAPLQWVEHSLRDEKGRVLFWCDKNWSWNPTTKKLTAMLKPQQGACLATATKPMKTIPALVLDEQGYAREKDRCIATWEGILARGMQVETPETRVNDAWKSLVIGSLMMMSGDRMNYSAGNAYQCMYEAESGDDTRALLLWGNPEAKNTLLPLLDYGAKAGLRFHDASFKLQMLAHYYWLTRDSKFIETQRPRWSKAVDLLITNCGTGNGLLPREDYCGDQAQKIYSLNANANAWRGLRDVAAVLGAMGKNAETTRINHAAQALRRATLDAVDKSVFRDTTPPFIPIALFGDEKPFPVLTASRAGSYWNLMIPYVLGADIFETGSEHETWMLRYLQEHGGLCMGMIRFDQHSGLFANTDGVDDLYTLRYAETLLQRDEPDRLLVSFYGKLAQGMTRNTFISAEGTGLKPLNESGRPMYLPPVCSGNAFFLWMLRGVLVQDHDADGDGQPDTLRLLFATPRPWLEDGKTIRIKNAPTAFGPVSLNVVSKLQTGKIEVDIDLPERNPADKILLRLRLPEGWQVTGAEIGKDALLLDTHGDVDLSGLQGKQKVVVRTKKTAR